MTTIWPEDCLWISEDVYERQAYNQTLQLTNHTCVPCEQTSRGCNVTYDCGFVTEYCENDGCEYTLNGPGRRRAAFRKLLQRQGSSAAQAGTQAIEGFAGTLALPNNNVSACQTS
jgi:hypothetical protein